MKKIYDISLPISSETIVYPGDPNVLIKQISNTAQGDTVNISELTLTTHTATHIDAPRHLYSKAESIDEIPLYDLIGPVSVYEFLNLPRIELEHVQNLNLKPGNRILFKTDNSNLYRKNKFSPHYTYLSTPAARFLAQMGVKLVGIDYFSVDPFNEALTVHQILLKNGIIILEGINLLNVKTGNYELICLPLKIIDADGAPARVILRNL